MLRKCTKSDRFSSKHNFLAFHSYCAIKILQNSSFQITTRPCTLLYVTQLSSLSVTVITGLVRFCVLLFCPFLQHSTRRQFLHVSCFQQACSLNIFCTCCLSSVIACLYIKLYNSFTYRWLIVHISSYSVISLAQADR